MRAAIGRGGALITLALFAATCTAQPRSRPSPPSPAGSTTGPSCLQLSPPEGTLSITDRKVARLPLALGSPRAIAVCRYAALPSQRLVRGARVPDHRVPALASMLNALPLVPFRKAFVSCPRDRGDIDLVLVRYSSSKTIPIKVSLSGCRYASNRFGQPFATTTKLRAALRRLVGGPPG